MENVLEDYKLTNEDEDIINFFGDCKNIDKLYEIISNIKKV